MSLRPFVRDESINQIISSIAMEEIGLSRIVNAESEKIQHLLKRVPVIPGQSEPLAVKELIKLNKSLRRTLESVTMNQYMLKKKLACALSLSAAHNLKEEKIGREEAFHIDLSQSNAYCDITLKNVIYRLAKTNATQICLTLLPVGKPVQIDYRRTGFYDAADKPCDQGDGIILEAPRIIGSNLLIASQTYQKTWIRQKALDSETYAVCLVHSLPGGTDAQRIDLWVEWLFENVVYAPQSGASQP